MKALHIRSQLAGLVAGTQVEALGGGRTLGGFSLFWHGWSKPLRVTERRQSWRSFAMDSMKRTRLRRFSGVASIRAASDSSASTTRSTSVNWTMKESKLELIV